VSSVGSFFPYVNDAQSHKPEPHTDQIPVEFIKAGDRAIHSKIHKLINSNWNKEELPEGWKGSIIAHIYKEGDKCCKQYVLYRYFWNV